jgi:hypothetical protein
MADELSTEALKQAIEPVSDLIKRIAGPAADEIGEYLGAVFRPYTVMRKVEAMLKTQRMLKERGISPQSVPPRLLLPILEGASIEDDEDLHTRWAALLANASASPGSVHPSYIEILRQLDPQDAAFLDKLYDHFKETGRSVVRPWMNATYAEKSERLESGDNPEIPFNNLVRLGLIERFYEIDEKNTKVKVPISRFQGRFSGIEANVEGDLWDWFELSEVAKAFVVTCRAPKTIEGTAEDVK